MKYRWIHFVLPLLMVLGVKEIHAQAQMEVFGKNRIQYRQFDWRMIDVDEFKVYFYDRHGQALAKTVAEQIDKDMQMIQKEAGTLFKKPLHVFVYNTYNDYRQSNINYEVEHQVSQFNPAGEINISGDKLSIYYSGDYNDLKMQLRKGMSKLYLEHLFFGTSFKSLMNNAMQIDLPFWLTEGYNHYIVEEWTTKDESKWRVYYQSFGEDSIKENKLFNQLIWDEPVLAGKLFWKYIAENHHTDQLNNLLLSVQSKSNLQKGVKEVLDLKLRELFKKIIQHHAERLAPVQAQLMDEAFLEQAMMSFPKQHQDDEIRSLKISPRGSDVAYISWNKGYYEVVIQKMNARDVMKSRSVILAGGLRDHTALSDPDYPLIAWSNNGFKLGIVYEKNNRIHLRIYDAIDAKIKNYIIPKSRFDRVTGFTFMKDDQQILFSAIKKGQSDLFEMTLKGYRIKQLTDDEWDERDPIYVAGGSRKGILFLSNRTQPLLNIKPLPHELPSGHYQAFFYDTNHERNELLQLTTEELGEIEQAIPYGPDHFAFLSNKSGIKNRYLVYFNRDENNMDTAYTIPHTFYPTDILSHNYNAASSSIGEALASKDSFHIFFNKIDYPEKDITREWHDESAKDYVRVIDYGALYHDKPFYFLDGKYQSLRSLNHIIKEGDFYLNPFNTSSWKKDWDKNTSLDAGTKVSKPSTMSEEELDQIPQFYSEIDILDDSLEDKRIIYVDSTFLKIRPFTYVPNFKTVELGVKFDYSNIFSRYQSYQFQSGQYNSPNLAGMFIIQMYDQLEDYRINAGFQLDLGFSDYTMFLEYQNFKRRLDWSVQLMRQNNREQYHFLIDPSMPAIALPGKSVGTFLKGGTRYPLTPTEAFQLEVGLRHDQMIIKADHPLGLFLPNANNLYFLSRFEFIQDNTINPTLNIWNGMRYKLFFDYYHQLYTDSEYSLNYQADIEDKTKAMLNAGVDFRYYQKIYRNAIVAARVSAAHSFGPQKILYRLGGVENQMNSSSNNALLPSGDHFYIFQSLASNMRGYSMNSRNGNTYALLNAELRVPIISTFTNLHIQSSFLKHFQLVTFVDIGGAWEGFFPSGDNLSRDYHFTWPKGQRLPSVVVSIPNTDDMGLALGYGAGIRTQLLGYFFRFDAARNLRNDWSFHFSIGTDF